MAKNNDIKFNLPTVDDLFTTQEMRDDAQRESVRLIPLSEIDDFPDHPFHVRLDEAMQNLAGSIERFGILTPAVVRQKEDGRYELVSGHRRRKACELTGISEIPAIVRDMTRDEAVIFMVDANLQREMVLPSEKAFSYKMKLEAMNRRAGRPSNNLTPVVSEKNALRTNEIVGLENGDSREQVRRYIRLTELIPEILQMVDDGKIAFRPAVEISYLLKTEQAVLLETMEMEDCTPSLAQAIKMKKFSQDGRLNEDVLFSILSEEKGNQVEQFKMPSERIRKYFPEGTPKEKIEETIVKALELYRKRQRENVR